MFKQKTYLFFSILLIATLACGQFELGVEKPPLPETQVEDNRAQETPDEALLSDPSALAVISSPAGIRPDMISLDTIPVSYQGRIDFPFKTGDAGNFVLQAGEVVPFNWLDFPPDAAFYSFAIKTHEADQLIMIGTDFDSSDGVMIDWNVAENISGSVVGFACFGDGTCIGAEWSGEVYSGPLPPDQFCTVKLFNVGVVDVYLEPDKDSPVISHLIPAFYVQVYAILEDQWLLIDLTNLKSASQEVSSLSRGYVAQQESLELFGPCNSLIEN
jgi:hypothetical protein